MTKVETLDRTCGHLRPDVMKVDIQGAEGLFLKGAQRTITTWKPSLLMEINHDMLSIVSKTSPGEIHRQLTDFGYNIWTSSQRRLTRIATSDEFESNFSAGMVANILAVHENRVGDVNRRLQHLELAPIVTKRKRQRQKETTA